MSERPLILIVDDDRDIVRGMSLRLRVNGYDVLSAYDGAQGLALARKSLPRAVVLDLRMPVMDGLTMLAELRASPTTRTTPVVIVSANVADSARKRAMQLDASYFLQKPLRDGDLISALDTVLSCPEAAG
ncbi:MAG: response regulator [Planctomycetes bacterium]|nr:response regulator [Planctomycetota bacterium]